MAAEPYLNARQAAEYIGYQPSGGPAGTDKAMRAFYAFVRNKKIPAKRLGRKGLRFRRADLDRALDRATEEHDQQHQERLARMEALARKHARGEELRESS
jgi:hypothetical protein